MCYTTRSSTQHHKQFLNLYHFIHHPLFVSPSPTLAKIPFLQYQEFHQQTTPDQRIPGKRFLELDICVTLSVYTIKELAEIQTLLSDLLMGRSDESRDLFRAWRLDTDDMTYEQLLALGDKMGYVSTGLKESEIQRSIKKTKFLGKTPSPFSEEAEPKCSICQEEYEPKDKLGLLICAHAYHHDCIKQWLRHKKTCPVCKSEIVLAKR